MPSIRLKYKSPEFADEIKNSQNILACEMPGCCENAEYKAPKHRGLNEYYQFCVEHVREYNKAWDFFGGMSNAEVEKHMTDSLYGDRPTWKYTIGESLEDELIKAAQKTYGNHEEFKNSKQSQENENPNINSSTPEHEALAIMGLSSPVTIDDIKARYKILAKKYHPDLNKNDPKCEELLKQVNMAYTILKLAFEEYKKLPEHKF